jgi:hypothetical protein
MSRTAPAESAPDVAGSITPAAYTRKGWRERLADPAEVQRMLAAIREEKVSRRELHLARDKAADPHRRDTPLEKVDRSDPKRLFKLKRKHFPQERAEALGHFQNRWKRSKWMQIQDGYLEKVALAISSRDKFDGLRYANCTPGRLCGQVHHCPRCKLELEIRPALAEYDDVFSKAPFWLAMVPSITYRPEDAGLHHIVRKDAKGHTKQYRHDRPFVGRPTLHGIALDAGESDVVDKLLRIPFEFAKRLRDRGLVDGAFVTREIALNFVPRPEPVPEGQWRVAEVVIPHGNGLFNTRRRPSWRFAIECWALYVDLWIDWGLFQYGYPDLMVGKAMVDQEEIDRWIGYELKAMPFEKFYRGGIKNGCFLEHLNARLDLIVFRAIKLAFTYVRSPRKFGNLNSDPRLHANEIPAHRRYIGTKPPDRMIRRIRAKLRKCQRQQPPADLTEKLTDNEMQFLAERGSDGHRVTVADLERWDGER